MLLARGSGIVFHHHPAPAKKERKKAVKLVTHLSLNFSGNSASDDFTSRLQQQFLSSSLECVLIKANRRVPAKPRPV